MNISTLIPTPSSEPITIPILIVDDRKENRIALRALIETGDNQIIEAASGNDALRIALEQEFALILMDVQMPEMDGFETAEFLRKNPRTCHVPLIFVTAINKEERHVFRGYESGAVDYISKPIQPDILRSKVRVFCDIYLQKQQLVETQKALVATNEKLSLLLAEISHLMHIAAHDLRNPLTCVSGLGEVLADMACSLDPLDKFTVGKFAHEIVNQSHRMNELIKRLLNAKAAEDGTLDVREELFDLQEILAAVVHDYQQPADTKKQILFVAGSPAHLFVKADKTLTRNVFDNLISNAVKYSPVGGQIHVSYVREGSTVCCKVTDQGPGFTDSDKSRLFQKFARLSAKPTGGESSTGLGLYIVHSLIETMGGRILCESEVGRGTSFTVSLRASS